MLNTIKNFANDESGATMIEYSILIGLVTAATVGAIRAIEPILEANWTDLQTALEAE